MGFDKCMMSCSYHYSIQNNFTTLKKCVPPIHSSPPPATSGNQWFFFTVYSFVFSRIWNHTVCSLFRLLSFKNMHLGFLHDFHDLITHFFLGLNNIPLSEMSPNFFIHSPTEGYLGCFQVLTITNEAAVNIRVHKFSMRLGKYLG